MPRKDQFDRIDQCLLLECSRKTKSVVAAPWEGTTVLKEQEFFHGRKRQAGTHALFRFAQFGDSPHRFQAGVLEAKAKFLSQS